MRPVLITSFLFLSATAGFAQSNLDTGLHIMLGVGVLHAGVNHPGCNGKDFGTAGVYPRIGRSVYMIGVLEKWGDAGGEDCQTLILRQSEMGVAEYHDGPQPTSRYGVGAGFDFSVEKVRLTSRVAGGKLTNSAPWFSAALGARFKRGFVQAEFGRERAIWTERDEPDLKLWTSLAGFQIGFLL